MTTKNALIRYRTIDRCLQNTGRQWTLNDLIEACSDALYDLEGKDANVSKRTIQLDIQLMRSDKLGYNAPIEVYSRKYYRYADPAYRITDVPLTESDMDVLSESVTMLRQFRDFSLFNELDGVLQKLEDKIHRNDASYSPIIHLDKNESLKGLEHLDVLYQAIAKRILLWISYQSFKARSGQRFQFHGCLLKEYNNRWFLIGRKETGGSIINLALDRIEKIEADLQTEYDPGPFDADAHYKDTIGVTVLAGQPHEIRLWIDRVNAPYVLTKPLHASQVFHGRQEDGGIEISITVQINYELERRLLGFGDGLKVLSPKRFRGRMRGILKRALKGYQRGE